MQIGKTGPWDKGVTLSTWRSGGQRSVSHEAKNRLGGLAEVAFSTPLGGVAFLV